MHRLRKILAVFLTAGLLLTGNAAAFSADAALPQHSCGDLNEDAKVNTTDALLALRISIGKLTPTEVQKEVADVNCDESINTTDALQILKHAVGSLDRFKLCDRNVEQAMQGLFTGATTVLTDTQNVQIGESLGMSDADFVADGRGIRAVYAKGGNQIVTARSADGIHFQDEAVLYTSDPSDGAEQNGISAPSVAQINGNWYVVYLARGKNDAMAFRDLSSEDGVRYEYDNEIYYRSRFSAEESGGIGSPCLFTDENNSYYLAYSCVDSAGTGEIVLAYDYSDIYSLERTPSSSYALIAPSAKGFDEAAAGANDVMHSGEYYYMVYETKNNAGEYNLSVARSKDAKVWYPLGWALLSESLSDTASPHFAILNDTVFIYYSQDGALQRLQLDYDKTYQAPAFTYPEETVSPAAAAKLAGIFSSPIAEADRTETSGNFVSTVTEQLDQTGIGGSFHMHFGDYVYVDNTIYSYYITGGKTGKMATGLATSTDGINFTNLGVVVDVDADGWDNNMTAFAGVWRENGVTYLVYEGSGSACNGAIGLAVSTDGIHFEKQGKILDYTRLTGNHESVNIGTPDLYKVGDTWYLFYHSYDGTDCQICVATGADLFHLRKCEENPILPCVDGTFESGTTGRRDVIYAGGWFYMVYEVSTDQPYGTASWGHSFARSKDLIHWQRLGKTLYSTTGGGMGHDGPNWYVQGDEVYVCFRDTANTTTRTKLVSEP